MRALAAALGAVVLVVAGVVFLWPAPDLGPVPIRHGTDTCAFCRMPLTRPGFGGELRDRAGVATTYDDIGCMLRAMLAKHEELPGAWVEDHESFELVPLLAATLVRAPGRETPMGSGLVAFGDEHRAAAFIRAQGGEVTTLETILSSSRHATASVTAENP